MDNKEQNTAGPIDIEDLKEQGVRSDSVGSITPGSQKGKSEKDHKYEMGQEITQGMDLKKAFSAVRDLDVDAMGKSKAGFDFNFLRKK